MQYNLKNIELPENWVSQYNLPASFNVGGTSDPTLLILGAGFLSRYGPMLIDTHQGLNLSVSRISNSYLVSGYYQGSDSREISNFRVNFGGLSKLDREFLQSNIVPTPHPARQDHCTGCRITKCLSCEADQYNLDPLTRIENELILKSITFKDSKFSTELPFNQHITQLPCYFKEAIAVMGNF